MVQRPKHVFVSYAREDRRFAQELTNRLRDARRVPWQDMRNLRGGDDWQEAIDEALRNAEALVVVMSPHATRSQYVTYEWAFALGAGVRVIPVIRKTAEIHPRLLRLQYVDFTKRVGTPWIDLRRALPARPAKLRVRPQISAQLIVVSGRPQTEGGYYAIRLSVEKAPRSTSRITYEAHDETLERRKWLSRSAERRFAVEILANGDVLITAVLRSGGGKELRIASTLSDALRRGHGRKPNPVIRKALQMLAKRKVLPRRGA